MSKQHADSTTNQNPKITLLSDKDLLEAVRNGNTAAVRAVLEKHSPGSKTETVAFEAVHEACRGNHNECLAMLLPYVETTQMGFGILLSECVHADHTACTEVLLQHWKSVCSNVSFVPHDSKDSAGQTSHLCPAMWEDPAVCQVFIGAGADIETKNDDARSPLKLASRSGALTTVMMLVKAGADARATDAETATCLITAAYGGHADTVRYLVDLPEVDLNHQDSRKYSVLHFAVEQKYADVVQVLIDAGADIETKNCDGRSPLHLASILGELTTVKMLVKAGADVRATDAERDTCLTLAAYDGHTDTVRYLVGLPEVDLNHQDSNNFTALHFAVQEKRADVVQVLIDAGADIETKDDEGRSPLLLASIEGELTTVKTLVEAGADVRATDAERDTCLTLAAHFGHTETVRYLVGLPEVDLNHQEYRNFTALHFAVQEKHGDLVQVLIDVGADIETKTDTGRSPLHLASLSGALTTVMMLVKAGADVRATDSNRDTCLTLAAHFGHTDTVRYLVGLPEVDLNHQDSKNYNTALHVAVERKHGNVVQVLIDAGADIETRNDEGRSPLHLASISGELTTMKMLVKAGADVRDTDADGDTCLTLAAYDGHTDTVRYLLCLPEVDLNHQDSDNYTALHVAVNEKHGDVVQVLIGAGADIETRNDKGGSPLHTASISGELTTVKMLVEAGADVRATTAQRDTCLTLAAYLGHTDTVRYLVSLPEVDLNHQDSGNCTVLHIAVQQEHADVVQVLIDAGADIEAKDDEGHSPLHLASISGELTTVKVLVKAGADVRATDACGNTCLILAAHHGHTETVRYLVSLPEVDLNHQDSWNCTVLHCAAQENRSDVVQVLIDAGADIETKNDEGRSPLHLASISGELTTVKMLVKAGADVRDTDAKRATCLTLAACFGHTDTVHYLLCLPEVDLNHQDSDNYTALHFAVEVKDADVVQVLIDKRADIETRDHAGRSPLHLASISGELVTMKMLVEAGADVRATDANRVTCLMFAAYCGHTDTVRYLLGLPKVDLNHEDTNNCTALDVAVQGKHTYQWLSRNVVISTFLSKMTKFLTFSPIFFFYLHCAECADCNETILDFFFQKFICSFQKSSFFRIFSRPSQEILVFFRKSKMCLTAFPRSAQKNEKKIEQKSKILFS